MITVLGSIGMDLLFSLPHLPAVGETVLTPAYTTAMGGKGANQAVEPHATGAGCVSLAAPERTFWGTRRDQYSGPRALIWSTSQPSMPRPAWLRFG
jgi:hypothetical protein